MTFELDRLIREAARIPGACSSGLHNWESDGGRRCPRGCDGCSQTVYRCRTCGDYDYGEAGGPSAAECLPCSRQPIEDDDDSYVV